MRSFLDPQVLGRLAPLPLKARVPMLGNVAGKHRSPIRGSSVEFASYRKYVPGDDTRRLDWRAYGRSDRFYIKEFEADTNLRLCLIVDTSGSMSSSMVYAGIYASVMASLPTISTKLVMFSTAVVDLTDELDDPVDMLFGIQLRGGTNIEKAVAYCEQIVERPTETTLILITDLYEGGDKELLVERLNVLVQRGVQVVTLLALNDEGAPRFSRELASQLVMLGIPSFACTPQHFPGLMGAILDGRDVEQWAAGQGIVTAPDN